VYLERWQIRRSDKGELHFVGFNIADCDGRVSTPVKTFDPVKRTGITASGSKYRLVGRAGRDSDAEYVWSIASRVWGITSWTDITADLVPDWRQAQSLAEKESNGPSPGFVDESSSLSWEDGPAEPLETGDLATTGEGELVCFRAEAYWGEYIDSNRPLGIVSEVAGAGMVDSTQLLGKDPTQAFLMAVRSLMETKARHQRPIDGASLTKPAMTIWIEKLAKIGGMAGEAVARFDLVIDDEGVHASVHVLGQPRVDIGPVIPEDGDGPWEMVIRFLPVGDVVASTLPGCNDLTGLAQ
jgi:hypothetical protein